MIPRETCAYMTSRLRKLLQNNESHGYCAVTNLLQSYHLQSVSLRRFGKMPGCITCDHRTLQQNCESGDSCYVWCRLRLC
jgi:hypothetical protein